LQGNKHKKRVRREINLTLEDLETAIWIIDTFASKLEHAYRSLMRLQRVMSRISASGGTVGGRGDPLTQIISSVLSQRQQQQQVATISESEGEEEVPEYVLRTLEKIRKEKKG